MKKPHIRKSWERTRATNNLAIGESVTDTSPGNNTNINEIVKRFARTGEMPEPPAGQPKGEYLDVTGLQEDLTTLINKQRSVIAETNKAQLAEKSKHDKKIQSQLQELKTLQEQQKQQQEAPNTATTDQPSLPA